MASQQIRSYLGKRGYILLKSQWSEEILKSCRQECTVSPYSPIDFGEPPQKFPIYRECSSKLYLPKFYGIHRFGNPDQIRIPAGDDIHLSFSGSLRDHQVDPVSIVMSSFERTGGGILSVGCGWGKTIAACYMISQLKKKTFVLVHKEFLMNQWIERIQGVLPNARIGKVQGPKVEIENKDIVIGMVQSVAMKEYDLHAFDSFGFLILDEAHRIPSKEFSKSFMKIQCPYMLALSATPERNDGLTKVLKWFVGEIVYEKKSKIETTSRVRRIFFHSQNRQYRDELILNNGQHNRAAMINNLADFKPRISAIVKILEDLVREDDRQVLVLSDRRELLREIEFQLNERSIDSGYYVGGMKQNDLEESAQKSVILATYPMAAEGLDISTIDTILLATPKTQIEQAVGRIRPKPGDNTRQEPLVVDIVDDFSIFSNQAQQRKRFYKKKGYLMEMATWDGDKGEMSDILEEFRPKMIQEERPVPNAGFSIDDLIF